MECKHCNSTNVIIKDSKLNRYKCKDCGRSFRPNNTYPEKESTKIGMTIQQFRAKHDIDYIVHEALKRLDKDTIYEKADLYKLCGLSASTQGLGAALESHGKYYGKTNGKLYFSHPDTILMLKNQAKLN